MWFFTDGPPSYIHVMVEDGSFVAKNDYHTYEIPALSPSLIGRYAATFLDTNAAIKVKTYLKKRFHF